MNQSTSPKTAPGRVRKQGFIARRLRRIGALRHWGHTDRKGSVLLVVIGLLLLLMLISFTFFTFASQENSSAEYYADAGKFFTIGLDVDALFDYGLEQLIIGPYESNKQSALWPGYSSLVPREIGLMNTNTQGVSTPFDRQPHNGLGVNVLSGPQGQPIVDSNYDGNTNSNDDPKQLNLNFSYAATRANGNPGVPRSDLLDPTLYPTIDAGYTYPDINSPFLAHIPVRSDEKYVVIPSFHRPQYLRYETGSALGAAGSPRANWQNVVETVRTVMRPHPMQVCVDNPNFTRFISPLYDPPGGISVTSPTPHTILPFPFDTDTKYGPHNQGIWSDYTNTSAVNYDVDNDGATFVNPTTLVKFQDKEGVWLDLNFPAQVLPLPDGRTYIPLFSFTVVNADGLVNLNTAGNHEGFTGFPIPGPSSGSPQISKSNLAVSRSEINPWWALTAHPRSGNYFAAYDDGSPPKAIAELQDYRGFFGLSNQNSGEFSIGRHQAANMDLFFLLRGRPKFKTTLPGGAGTPEYFTLTDLASGRWGESGNLRNLMSYGGWKGTPTLSPPTDLRYLPRPGSPDSVVSEPPSPTPDDDSDQYAGANETDQYLPNISLPSDIQPFDNLGAGSWLQTGGAEIIANLVTDPSQPATPTRFLQYNAYSSGSLLQRQVANGGTALANSLVVSPARRPIDEADETMVDGRFKYQIGGWDDIFEPVELAGLHLSDSDFKANIGATRLRSLMPFNLERNLQAEKIRKHFTTESWDRQQHGFASSPYMPSSGALPTDVKRISWEYGADWDGDNNFNEFPPYANRGANAANQPFRLELVYWIGSKLKENPAFINPLMHRQLRLNINRLLRTANADPSISPISQNNPLILRHLTPHPNDTGIPASPTPRLSSAPIPTNLAGVKPVVSGTPLTDNPQIEYWARRDRQLMARDLYVLLYMLGGGEDLVNYAIKENRILSAGPPVTREVYDDAQLAEMAQFAVNVVDELDPDDVITRFEYDKDLSNGWNLDDNAYTNDSTERGEVYGVEAQKLVVSEAIVIRVPQGSASNTADTPFDDMQPVDRAFTHVELHNVSPFNVAISNAAWRLRVIRNTPGSPNRALVFKDDSLGTVNGTDGTYIAPNKTYTIGSMGRSDGGVDKIGASSNIRCADFQIDHDADTFFSRIVPPVEYQTAPTSADNPPSGSCLDLNRGTVGSMTNSNSQFTLTDDSGATVAEIGGFLQQIGATESVDFVLERRVHLNRVPPTNAAENADNPWVAVDTFTFSGNVPTYTPTSTPQNSKDQLRDFVKSLERPQLFDRHVATCTTSVTPYAPPATTPARFSSIGLTKNAVANNAQTVWQPHFDRDLASVIDLFRIPLYGPDQLTAKLTNDGISWGTRIMTEAGAPTYQPQLAQAKFLRPRHRNPAAQARHHNRWYRVLELLEFPSRVDQTLENYLKGQPPLERMKQLARTPGKINLNTIRSPEVLYALLDDPKLITTNDTLDTNYFKDSTEPNRNWWYDFKAARDGYDPQVRAIVPGSPSSRPFRNLAHLNATVEGPGQTGVPPLEQTLLRKTPFDGEDLNGDGLLQPGEDYDGGGSLNPLPASGAVAPRRLFEARTATDMTNNIVDPHTRQRLLSKVANNSTTRGHVFVVWMTVGFFEAYQPDPAGNPTVYRIGQELDWNTNPTRYRGFFVIDRSLLEDGYNSQTNTFDFRKFIQYRKVLN